MKIIYLIIIIIAVGAYIAFTKTSIQTNSNNQITLNLPYYWILNNTNIPAGIMNYVHDKSFITTNILSGKTSEFNTYCNQLLDNVIGSTKVEYKTNSKGVNECIVNSKYNPDYSSIFNCPKNLIYITGFLLNNNDVTDYNKILDSFTCP